MSILIGDGSSWPRPAMEADEDYGIGHKLRYSATLTKSDRLVAASIIDAYGYLVAESTRAKRDLVCREIRAAMRERAS